MTNDRTFEFKALGPDGNRITVKVLDSFNRNLYNQVLAEWRRQNPPPPIPVVTETIPWAGTETGTKERSYPNPDDPSYLIALDQWSGQMNHFAMDLMNMHIDIKSLDDVILGIAKDEMTLGSLTVDPVSAFLSVVHDPTLDDDGISELGRFYEWMRELGGPSEALITRFLAEFRRRNNEPQGENAQGVRVADTTRAERQGVDGQAESRTDGDGSGGQVLQ